LSAAHVRHLSLLPRGNQCEVAETVLKQGLSSRQTSLLVARLGGTVEPGARSALLSDPLKYLVKEKKVEVEREKDPRLSEDGNLLRDCLLALKGNVHWLERTLRGHPPTRLDVQEAEVLSSTARETIRGLKQALDLLMTMTGRRRKHEGEAEAVAVRSSEAEESGGLEAWDSPGS